jgi:hypothetical protein
MSQQTNAPFQFEDPAVAEKYEPVDVDKNFQIRVPSLQWHGQFSEITTAVAEQLIKEKYNRIREKKA